MLCRYQDILNLTDKEPVWFDEVGVPRFCEFHPDRVNNIYAEEVVLLLIACQSCGIEYRVAMSQYGMDRIFVDDQGETKMLPKFSDDVHRLHYGDPPCWNKDCAAGATMNCVDLKVLEFWWKKNFEWARFPELEITFDD